MRSCLLIHFDALVKPTYMGILLMLCLIKPSQAETFPAEIVTLLQTHCIGCHSTEKMEGELDLQRLLDQQAIGDEPSIWERVIEQVSTKQMPPTEKSSLSQHELTSLTSWLNATLDKIAAEQKGDPGPVVLRRLSNVEYTYTIRDLTGLANLDPAEEFPIDGAAGEGFTNAGAALVMSPALLAKYLEAAKGMSRHAMLLPGGIRFEEATSERDRTDALLARIRDIYHAYTVERGDTHVNLQGIEFATNAGGRLPLDQYFDALKHSRTALENGTAGVDAVALERKLSGKYLHQLMTMLRRPATSIILNSLQEKWRSGELSVADVEPWQETLWRFSSVGHIGKANGPRSWQEPASPLVTEHEIRHKLSSPSENGDATVYLEATSAQDGDPAAFAIWENLRIVAPERSDVLLSQVRDLAIVEPDNRADTDPPVAYGLDESLFRPRPHLTATDASTLCVEVPSRIELRIPRSIAQNGELVATCRLHPLSSSHGAIQMRIHSAAELPNVTSDTAVLFPRAPVIVHDAAVRQKLETAFHDFRELFPIALCYPKIVPVDEVVTLRLFYREDEYLKRLMMSDQQSERLDQLWAELEFVSESPLKLVDAFEQLYQYATQDADPIVFEPLREPITQAAEIFRTTQELAQPKHVDAVIEFASLAWRRPLTGDEEASLRKLYQSLREQTMPHEASVQMLLTRILMSPAFLYRGEKTAGEQKAAPVSPFELATRLSYFLWSSTPDAELRSLAAAGSLSEKGVLQSQVRRMMSDPRTRRLALEFGCQWLHVRDLATLDEKSERHFPTFLSVREAMQEETVLFFTDIFQQNGSILSLLDAKHTFLNRGLAAHYGIDISSDQWARVSLTDHPQRGGVLAFASTLSKQSGASRTSPILRGNWVSEVLLGERLPRPPKGVPILPEEAAQGLTERQMIEKHSSDANCATCHQRIDPFGFALEGFDAIGRERTSDAVGQPIDTRTTLPDGTVIEGITGLRDYLMQHRRDDFVRQFCRKLLGYALGRSVQLSDKPLLETMQTQLQVNDFQIHTAIELIVLSPQFQQIRGSGYSAASETNQ